MLEAVDAIGKEVFELGTRMENTRLQAFGQMILGEMASQEPIGDPLRAQLGIEQLLKANQLYQQDASILSPEEHSRVCLALSTLYRKVVKDTSKAKRWLELAKDKITDQKVLLQFYVESTEILEHESKFYSALDSAKKAVELAKRFYRDDDYTVFELQMTLADLHEKCEDRP